MVTQNHFVIPAMVLEKFRSRGFPEGVTLTADHCTLSSLRVSVEKLEVVSDLKIPRVSEFRNLMKKY